MTVISTDLARGLLAAGVLWSPASGDRFIVVDRDMDADIFFIAEMTVEVHEFSSGRIIGFNGTTEWALDSLELGDVLWLPREDQLRELLGDRFRALHRVGAEFVVVIEDDGRTSEHLDADVENAYARALLAVAAR